MKDATIYVFLLKNKNIFPNGIEPYQRHFQLARNSRMSLLQNSRPATYLDIYLACGYEFGACWVFTLTE